MEFTHNNRTFLAIEVPDGATNFVKDFDVETDEYCILANDEEHYIKTPDYWNFEILFLLKDATEEQAMELVKKINNPYYDNNKHTFFDYKRTGHESYTIADFYYDSIKSLHSRLTSLGMDTNKPILLIEKI